MSKCLGIKWLAQGSFSSSFMRNCINFSQSGCTFYALNSGLVEFQLLRICWHLKLSGFSNSSHPDGCVMASHSGFFLFLMTNDVEHFLCDYWTLVNHPHKRTVQMFCPYFIEWLSILLLSCRTSYIPHTRPLLAICFASIFPVCVLLFTSWVVSFDEKKLKAYPLSFNIIFKRKSFNFKAHFSIFYHF